MPHELPKPLEIPTDEIKTVIDWIKSEQVRVINQDRTLGRNKIQRLDWLTQTVDNLVELRTHAQLDQREVANMYKAAAILREGVL